MHCLTAASYCREVFIFIKMSLQDTNFTKNQVIKANGKKLRLHKPVVMGIVNLNQDSFYAASRYSGLKKINAIAEQQQEEGAAIIDLGVLSSRPGASLGDSKTELKKLIPVVKEIRRNFPEMFISIDTFRSEVAKAAAAAGADIINDISSGELDPLMFSTVAQLRLPYVMMHMQGVPSTMQVAPSYPKGVIKEINTFFRKKIQLAQSAGIQQLVIDPGFGFGKSLEHNYELLSGLDKLNTHQFPLLAGISRKSMISKVLECSSDEALNGTTALHTVVLLKGANILRVHDVKAAVEVIKLTEMLKNIK